MAEVGSGGFISRCGLGSPLAPPYGDTVTRTAALPAPMTDVEPGTYVVCAPDPDPDPDPNPVMLATDVVRGCPGWA